MQKLVLAVLFALGLGATAQAQDTAFRDMEMIAGCQDSDAMRAWLKEEFGEIAFLSGEGIFRRFDGQFADADVRVYANPSTFTFTVLAEFEQDNISCVVFMGDNLGPVIRDGQAL